MKKLILAIMLVLMPLCLISCDKKSSDDKAFAADLEKINNYTIDDFNTSFASYVNQMPKVDFVKASIPNTKISTIGMDIFDLPDCADYYLYKKQANIYLGYTSDKPYLYKVGTKRLQLIYKAITQSLETKPSTVFDMLLSSAKVNLTIEDIINNLYFKVNDFKKENNEFICKEEVIEAFLKRLTKDKDANIISSFIGEYEHKISLTYKSGKLNKVAFDVMIDNYNYRGLLSLNSNNIEGTFETIYQKESLFQSDFKINDEIKISALFGDNLSSTLNLSLSSGSFDMRGNIAYNDIKGVGYINYQNNCFDVDIKNNDEILIEALIAFDKGYISSGHAKINPCLFQKEGEEIQIDITLIDTILDSYIELENDPGDLVQFLQNHFTKGVNDGKDN